MAQLSNIQARRSFLSGGLGVCEKERRCYTRPVRIATPAALRAFEERYRRAHGIPTGGLLPLTYHPLLLIARAS